VAAQTNAMKIAYSLIAYDAIHSGVYTKILDQVTFWRSQGNQVQLFLITDRNSAPLWKTIDPFAIILVDSNLVSKVINRFKLVKNASKSNPTLIYLRDSFPILLPKTRAPIILEVQSLVGNELKLRNSNNYLFFSLLKKRIYSRVSGGVFVTSELKSINEFGLGDWIPKIAIGNAINLSRVSPLPLNQARNLSLFFVGTPNQPWHGVSDIVRFGELNPDIYVHIVGSSGESRSPNLFFYGRLQNSDYYEIASRCDAGVGTLKLTANQMVEASPLKVREYLAMGLPVITRYQDVDLDPSSNFLLQLPVDERAFSDFSLEIRSFLESWKSKRVDRSEVFHLDVSVKESLRLGFFEEVRNIHKAKMHSKGQK
jgi:glycosyltransferase involved in cell wall biosynthesis